MTAEQKAIALAGVKKRLLEILAAKRLDNVQFNVVETDDLPVNPRTRKFQLIVDAGASPLILSEFLSGWGSGDNPAHGGWNCCRSVSCLAGKRMLNSLA